MADALDVPEYLEIPQDFLFPLEPASTPPRHKALKRRQLVFAPAPTVVPVETLPADRPTPLVGPRRRFTRNWEEAAVILLILSCAAACVERLLWAIQP